MKTSKHPTARAVREQLPTHPDAELIDKLGGAAELARRLGYEDHKGRQRVQQWKTRGIPPEVKLEFPHIFLVNFKVDKRKIPALLKPRAR